MAISHWWLGTDVGSPTDLAVAANTSEAGSGGAPGVTVPGTGDELQYDANGNNPCTFTQAFALGGLTTLSGYTAKLDLDAYNLTMDDGADIILDGAGEFDLGSSTVSITNGTFDCLDVGTFTEDSSTVLLDGTSTLITKNAVTFNNLTIETDASVDLDASSGATTNVSGLLSIDGSLTIPGAKTLRANDAGNLVDVYSNADVQGSGSFTIQSPGTGGGLRTMDGRIRTVNCSFVYYSSDSLPIPAATYEASTVNITKFASTYEAVLGVGAFTFTNNFQFRSRGASGTLTVTTADATSILVQNNLTANVQSGSSLVIDDSGGSAAWNLQGDVIDSNDGTVTWSAGTEPIALSGTANQSLAMNSWVSTPTFSLSKSVGTVTVTDGSMVLGANSSHAGLTIDGSSASLDLDTYNLTGADGASFTVSNSADVDLGSATVSITNGTFDYSGVGTFTPGTALVELDGASTLITKNGETLHDVTINAGASVTLDAASGDTTNVDGVLTIDGALTIPGAKTFRGNGAGHLVDINAGGDVQGGGSFAIQSPGTGGGLRTMNGRIRTTNLDFAYFSADSLPIPAATYEASTTYISKFASTYETVLGAGAFTFTNNIHLRSRGASGTLTLTTTDATSIVVQGDLTANVQSGSSLVIDDSGGSAAWNLQGDVIDSNDGTFTWTKGTGAYKATGGNNQNWDLMSQALGDFEVAKSAGTLTFATAFTFDSFLLSTGTVDFNGALTHTTVGDFTVKGSDSVTPSGIVGCTFDVGGNALLQGNSNSAKLVFEVADGNTVTINATGTCTARYVQMKNCVAGGTSGIAYDSIDGGGNTGWTFVDTPAEGDVGIGLSLSKAFDGFPGR